MRPVHLRVLTGVIALEALTALWAPAPVQGQDAACRVIVYSGSVSIVGASGEKFVQRTAAVGTAEVTTGDQVTITTEGGIAFLRIGTRTERLEPRRAKRVDCAQGAAASDSAATRVARLIDLVMVTGTTASQPLAYRGPGAKNDERRLSVLFPQRETGILGTQPAFAWSQSSSSFEVVLLVPDTEKVVWRRVVTGVSAMSYPAGKTPLETGQTYIWEIRDLADPSAVDSATFHVATDAQRQEMREEGVRIRASCERYQLSAEDCALAVAGLYNERGLSYEAVQLLLSEQEKGVGETTIAPVLNLMLQPRSSK